MSRDAEFGEYLEKRAADLGLPTDPEAYKDGGLSTAAIAGTLAEAETLAAMLKAEGTPAWVRSPLGSLALAAVSYAILVPSGCLADAQRLLAEHHLPPSGPAGDITKDPGANSDEPGPQEREFFEEAERASPEETFAPPPAEAPFATSWWTVIVAVVIIMVLLFILAHFMRPAS